jgi:hypothetical protein
MFLGVHLLSIGVIAELALKTGDYLPKRDVRPTVAVLEVSETLITNETE